MDDVARSADLDFEIRGLSPLEARPRSATAVAPIRHEYRSGKLRSHATTALPMVVTQTLQRAVPGLTNRKRRNKPNRAELPWKQQPPGQRKPCPDSHAGPQVAPIGCRTGLGTDMAAVPTGCYAP